MKIPFTLLISMLMAGLAVSAAAQVLPPADDVEDPTGEAAPALVTETPPVAPAAIATPPAGGTAPVKIPALVPHPVAPPSTDPDAIDPSPKPADPPVVVVPASVPASVTPPPPSKAAPAESLPVIDPQKPIFLDTTTSPPRVIPVHDRPIASNMDRPTYVPEPEAPLPYSMGAMLGFWSAGDLSDFSPAGLVGGGIVGQYQFHPRLAVQGRASFGTTSYSGSLQQAEMGRFNLEASVLAIPLEVGLLGSMTLRDRLHLYGGPGAGYYIFSGELTSKHDARDGTYDMNPDNAFGFYGLIGLRFAFDRHSSVFLEAKYTFVKPSFDGDQVPGYLLDNSEFPLSRDPDFSGVSVQAGYLYSF